MRTQDSIIGNSAALTAALEQLSQLARIDRPVLLLGERGTGKELAAQRLHFLSPRWQAPLVKVNCAALADSLLESELFGHEAGAFTGATRTRQGRFERADGGTLFLDELGTMSTQLQEKLLRLIEYGEFERLGGQQTLLADVRVLAATNTDLRAQVERNQFRADLLDRLSFDVVHLPALRHRREDIPELAHHFAIQMSAELGWELFSGFTESALGALQQHLWPGNIRELKNAVERSLFRWNDPDTPVARVIIDPFVSPFEDDPFAATPSQPEATPAAAGETQKLEERQQQRVTNFHARVKQFETTLLSTALAENGYNQRRTAKSLGLSYDQMRGLVRKYNLANRETA